ncbi:MAG: chemotaxis protein CheD, partial [Zoogloea sp.]|nr:chemotaxis protein CheD [Zoogloea sp.]
MTVPINPAAIDIFLQPGEVYFGDRGTRIRTVLGSCVSITFWHPRLLLGGMCHIMLPGRIGKAPDEPDGRYADEAVSLLVDEMRAAGTQPRDYQAKLFGGG